MSKFSDEKFEMWSEDSGEAVSFRLTYSARVLAYGEGSVAKRAAAHADIVRLSDYMRRVLDGTVGWPDVEISK